MLSYQAFRLKEKDMQWLCLCCAPDGATGVDLPRSDTHRACGPVAVAGIGRSWPSGGRAGVPGKLHNFPVFSTAYDCGP